VSPRVSFFRAASFFVQCDALTKSRFFFATPQNRTSEYCTQRSQGERNSTENGAVLLVSDLTSVSHHLSLYLLPCCCCCQPENLLLKRKPRPTEDIEVKIIDFGLSKVRQVADDGCDLQYDSTLPFSGFSRCRRAVVLHGLRSSH